MELKDAVCQKCGEAWDERHKLEVTACGKVLCKACEAECENWRKFMLPNGTHCMATFEAEYFRYRLLDMQIPAPPAAVKKARKKYESILSGELFEMLAGKSREYKTIRESETAANARIELEAMRQTLYDRIQNTNINRHLFEIFKSLAEAKREYAKT